MPYRRRVEYLVQSFAMLRHLRHWPIYKDKDMHRPGNGQWRRCLQVREWGLRQRRERGVDGDCVDVVQYTGVRTRCGQLRRLCMVGVVDLLSDVPRDV